MRKTITLAFFFSSFIFSLYGGLCMNSSYQYAQVFENEKLENISANGSVLIKNTIVTNSVNVNGSLLVKESNLGILQVNGEVKIESSLIHGTALVNGALFALNSKLGEVSIASEKTIINDCEVDQMLIRKIGRETPLQILELNGNTIIHGDIIFESQNGKVITSETVKIFGSVIGGVLRSR